MGIYVHIHCVMALNSCKQVKVCEPKVSCIFAVIMTNSNVFEVDAS